jgi:hypothetical protein
VALGRPSAAGGRAAVAAVREAVRLMAAGDGDALGTRGRARPRCLPTCAQHMTCGSCSWRARCGSST